MLLVQTTDQMSRSHFQNKQQKTKLKTQHSKKMRTKYLNKVKLDLVMEFRVLNFKIMLSCVGDGLV